MLSLESYQEHERHLPAKGRFIIAQFDQEHIVVYQAFNKEIASYAVAHQKFGGDAYDFERTTWLKPSFLWMMHYSDWAQKKNQEHVLAIRMKRSGFEELLELAVMATYNREVYGNHNSWEQELAGAEVQLQWEPYQDLTGEKTDRLAVKIGIEGETLQRFNNEWILSVEDITDFVSEQLHHLSANQPDAVKLPGERVYAPIDLSILRKIDATSISL